jgi:biopolymer transport protein ExbB
VLEKAVTQFALLGAWWVLWLLVLLSLGCVAISIERVVYLVRDATERTRLGNAVNAFLRGGDAAAFRTALAGMTGFEARVLGAGIELAGQGPAAVEKAMAGTTLHEKMRMERGLSYLATVGSNAPFIGLLGTVLHIVRAFQLMRLDDADAMNSVMHDIGQALVATAVGLFVAIPAVVLYNLFTRWVKSRLGRSESLADLVVARLTNHEAA